MSVSDKVEAVLSLSGKKKIELAEALGLGSKQAMSTKISRDSWTASDLIKVAELAGCKLQFVFSDDQTIGLTTDDIRKG